jgi:zinc D-Ala-D-Ala carboxypeptidase
VSDTVLLADLSPHLSVAEFLATSHRDLLVTQRYEWEGSETVRANAARFARDVFEPVRTILGVPLHVTSGFRCVALNAAVGGVLTSRHILGLAADVVPIHMPLDFAMNALARAVAAGMLHALDRVIIEFSTWLHIQGAPEGIAPMRLVLASADGRVFHPYTGVA